MKSNESVQKNRWYIGTCGGEVPAVDTYIYFRKFLCTVGYQKEFKGYYQHVEYYPELVGEEMIEPSITIHSFHSLGNPYWWTRKNSILGRQSKKLQMQGLRILRNEAYLPVRRNDERWSVTQQLDFLRSRPYWLHKILAQHSRIIGSNTIYAHISVWL